MPYLYTYAQRMARYEIVQAALLAPAPDFPALAARLGVSQLAARALAKVVGFSTMFVTEDERAHLLARRVAQPPALPAHLSQKARRSHIDRALTPRTAAVDDIVRSVCDAYRIASFECPPLRQLDAPSRAWVTEARRTCFLLLHSDMGIEALQIADWFAKHSSSVRRDIAAQRDYIETDKAVRARYVAARERAMLLISSAAA